MSLRIHALGDRALILEGSAPGAAAWLQQAGIPGLREIVPASGSITIFYEPAELEAARCCRQALVESLAGLLTRTLDTMPPIQDTRPSRLMEIPVWYEGPDLGIIASHTGLPSQDVIEVHSAAEYVVARLGFAPGFPYLDGLPEKLSIPRLATPRTVVPRGSVGIANTQSCIYPVAIAGGWHLVGRTPRRLFRPGENPPVLLLPGDRVKFHPISGREFESMEAAR